MNFNIRRRLMAGFFTVVLLGAAVSVAVLQLLTTSIRQLENVVSVSDTIRQEGLKLRFDMMTMSDGIRGYLIDPSDKNELKRKKDADDEFLKDVTKIQQLAPPGEVRDLIQRAADMDSQSVNKLEDEVLQLISDSKADLAKTKYVGEYLPVRKQQEAIIKAASNEQATGVAQINRSLSQVDQVTQRNASASEELAATAEEMAAQADGLQGLVEFFRTGHEQLQMKSAPVSVTITKPAIHVPGNGRGHDADFGSF